LIVEGMNPEIDLFRGISVDFELQGVQRDLSIRGRDSIYPEAEDILWGLERGWDFELSKERLPFLQRSLKTEIGNLLSGGMNLMVVILVDFLAQDLLGRFDVGDIFSDTGSNQMVLEPTIGSFDFASGLRGKGMDDLHVALLQHLFPLRGRLIGLKVVLIPEGVSSPDKAKDRVGIDIIGKREAIAKDDGLEGLDVSPAGFFLDQSGIKDEPAVIIQRRDEIPFLLGSRCPEMIGGVMLNQFSEIMG
jgi:hypothetical protein